MKNNKLEEILTQVRQAENTYKRQPGSVLLVAVSKTKPSAQIAALYQQGQRHFGENYVQEALKKQQELGAYDITWHFIGPIQANKTKAIATYFDWVHSVDNLKVAERLSAQRPDYLPPLNVCVQVNISAEDSKSGITLETLPAFLESVGLLPRIKVRGVMAIPAPETEFKRQCEPYRALYQAVAKLNRPELDTFSFGMSGDLTAAIAEGATIVRIGSALFGSREYPAA